MDHSRARIPLQQVVVTEHRHVITCDCNMCRRANGQRPLPVSEEPVTRPVRVVHYLTRHTV